MDLTSSIILGLIEGFSEFLPISSTGHLILFSKLLGVVQNEFTKSFEIAIQSGAILAVIVLYLNKLLTDKNLIRPLITAFIPTGILGLIFYKIIKNILLESTLITVSALFLGGIVIIYLEKYFINNSGSKKIKDLSIKESLLVGFFQSISFIPGVSRAATTIFTGMFLRLSRSQAVEFSFLLAVPTMFAATGYDLVRNIDLFSLHDIRILLIGFTTSFISAVISIRFFINFAKNNNFVFFGWYRIVLAVVYFVLFT